ncbi:hypothetical protein TrRE_jg11187, partial [Triparma retinervis]
LDERTLEPNCDCPCCKSGKGYSRSKLHMMLKTGEPLAAQLMTAHNIAYMMRLVRNMRKAILAGKYEEFVRTYMKKFFPDGYSEEVMEGKAITKENRGDKEASKGDMKEEDKGKDEKHLMPKWVVEALSAAGIDMRKDL